MPETAPPLEVVARAVGALVGRFPVLFVVAVAATCLGAASGLLSKDFVDKELFESLILRPASRVQRESDYTVNHEDPGYASWTEAFNVRASRGSTRNVLARSNLVQTARFFADADVMGQAISHEGVVYTSYEMLSTLGTQPNRFTVLDCFQEGGYDYFGDLDDLGAGLITELATSVLAPFAHGYASLDPYAPRVTPYEYCLYARLAMLYTPSSSVNAGAFGRCRKFIDEDPAASNEELAALRDAYDFHRFYVYDMVLSSPSVSLHPWACKRPFASEAAGRCEGNATCCEVAQSTSADGSNPYYTKFYAQLDACAAFDFYPLSQLFAPIVGAAETYANASRLSFEDCASRRAAFDEGSATSSETVEALVEWGTNTILCNWFGFNSCGAPETWETNLHFADAVATQEELSNTSTSGECAQWDGGPDGLKLLPWISMDLTVADLSCPAGEQCTTKALQTVYLSNGVNTVRDLLEQRGDTNLPSLKSVGDAKELWLVKFGEHMHGRHDGGSMLHAAFLSISTKEAFTNASVPETELVVIGLCLIFLYTLYTLIAAAPPTARDRLAAAALAVSGILCVILGQLAGLGVGIYAGLKVSSLSVQVLPFLLLGLGINDLFVYSYDYLELTPEQRLAKGGPVGAIFADSGTSVTLTTAVNIIAFLMSSKIIRVRIVSHFAALAACGLFGTWFTITFAYTACIAMHARFSSSSSSSPEIEWAERLSPLCRDEKEQPGERPSSTRPSIQTSWKREFLPRFAAMMTTNRKGNVGTLLVTLVTVASLAGVGLPMLELDFPLYAIYPSKSAPANFFKTKIKHFAANYFMVYFAKFDYAKLHPLLSSGDDPSRYSLSQQIMQAKGMNEGQTYWYDAFIQYMLPCGAHAFVNGDDFSATEVEEACAASSFYAPLGGAYNPRCSEADQLTSPRGGCGPRLSASTLSQAEFAYADAKRAAYEAAANNDDDDQSTPKLASADVPACSAWPVQYFLCEGEPCFGAAELTSEVHARVAANETVVLGVHPAYYYECFNQMLRYDSAVALTSPAFNCEDPSDRTMRAPCGSVAQGNRSVWRGRDGTDDMDFASSLYWAVDLQTGAQWIAFIDSVRGKLNDFCSKTGVEVYPSGSFWKFYNQFKWIERSVITALGVITGVVYAVVCVFFFFRQPLTRSRLTRCREASLVSLLLTVSIATVVLVFISLMGLIGIWLNCFTTATVVMSFGVAVDLLAHTTYGFLLADGTAAQRAETAIITFLPPMLDGAVTTVLGFLCLGFTKLPYIFLYYFALYCILTTCGFAIGAVPFPALLAAAGFDLPRSEHSQPENQEFFKLQPEMRISTELEPATDEFNVASIGGESVSLVEDETVESEPVDNA